MRWLFHLAAPLWFASMLASVPGPARPAELGWAGRFDGTWHWALPDAPNGLKPTQSWHATGSAPDGSIYIGGMDHVTNSALYRLNPREGSVRYLGDARSASEAVRNWAPGETAQKFHTRPLWHDGKIYVATMDRSRLTDEYLTRRGFHWYAYDPGTGTFTDLSASEPGGTAVAHGNVVALASDPIRNVIYGAGVPTGEIYRFDVARNRTQVLGRPATYAEPYVYTGRVMWVDSRGRLYFTASNPKNPAVHGHVHYFDPETGFGEERGWALQEGQALEVGQCFDGGRKCLFSDDRGHVYRFDEVEHSWSYLGRIETGHIEVQIWQFAASEGKVYAATSTSPHRSDSTALYEFDLKTGITYWVCALADLDPALRNLDIHTGYDAWDSSGRFYFTSFNGNPDQRVIVTRVDPARLTVAIGHVGRR
jgi:outer membrane protein assembly factor BamB